mgnify:CR=1 FL=1
MAEKFDKGQCLPTLIKLSCLMVHLLPGLFGTHLALGLSDRDLLRMVLVKNKDELRLLMEGHCYI